MKQIHQFNLSDYCIDTESIGCERIDLETGAKLLFNSTDEYTCITHRVKQATTEFSIYDVVVQKNTNHRYYIFELIFPTNSFTNLLKYYDCCDTISLSKLKRINRNHIIGE